MHFDVRFARRSSAAAAQGLFALVLGCAPDPGGVLPEESITHPDAPPIAPFDECTVHIVSQPASSAAHVAVCSPLAYDVPPTGGEHYGQWAAFGSYEQPVPWGYLVHAMEHGAIVMAYHCESAADCDVVRAELASIVAARPRDPLCREDTPVRYVLAPAPDLEWPIAVLAWEHRYTATCLDRSSIEAFFDAHYGAGPEATCAGGVDRSVSGWCP